MNPAEFMSRFGYPTIFIQQEELRGIERFAPWATRLIGKRMAVRGGYRREAGDGSKAATG
jgi:hypothetical protein